MITPQEHPDQLGWELVLQNTGSVDELQEMGELIAQEKLPESTLEVLRALWRKRLKWVQRRKA